MGFEHIKLESIGGIARITIDRPKKLNAIAMKTRSELLAALRTVQSDSKTRCLILTGAGTQAFSSGEDLNEVTKLTPASAKRWARDWGDFLASFMRVPQPIVTSCRGHAVGAGWQLFLLGDYRISSETANFSMPEVDVGLPSIMGGAILMSIIGMGQLGRFTLMGEGIDAMRALELGLVHQVVRDEELDDRTLAAARRLARKPLNAVRLQKGWSQKFLLENYRKGIMDAASIYSQAFASGEPKKGIASFFTAKKT